MNKTLRDNCMVIKTVKDNKFTLLVCANVRSIETMLQYNLYKAKILLLLK